MRIDKFKKLLLISEAADVALLLLSYKFLLASNLRDYSHLRCSERKEAL